MRLFSTKAPRGKYLYPEQRREIGEAIAVIQKAFGQPHRHQGIGVRKLARDYYEARIGLQKRLVFENKKNALFFHILGDHDQIKAFLKKY
ncbi:MAG: hypothetical protein ACOY3I_02285 [Verrucomicrobiota bacterium]